MRAPFNPAIYPVQLHGAGPLHFLPAAFLAWTTCKPGTESTPCTFLSLLHLLQFLAVLLGCILVGVLALAIHVYRKNRTSPEDRRRGNRTQKRS